MGKTLVLVRDKNKYFWRYMNKSERIDIEALYKKEFSLSFFNNLRKKDRKYQYFYFGIFNEWKYKLDEYDKIIFLDSSYTKQADSMIKRCKKRGAEVFFFYWNKMNLDYDMAQRQMQSISKDIKVYSYSRYDCENHNIPFNTTMYAPVSIKAVRGGSRQDIIFGGRLSNERILELDHILKALKDNNITYKIDACLDTKQRKNTIKPQNFELKSTLLDYETYIKEINDSKAVLNIDKYEGMGCSLRAMEAIFYHKKYITDNKDVKKELFYKKENVFILGEDNIEELSEFLNSPYEELSQDMLDYYTVEKWAERF